MVCTFIDHLALDQLAREKSALSEKGDAMFQTRAAASALNRFKNLLPWVFHFYSFAK